MTTMTSFKARVRNGRLQLDVPTDLPEGSEVELVIPGSGPVDDLDDLDEAERARLEADLQRSEEDVRAGRVIAFDDLLRQLRR